MNRSPIGSAPLRFAPAGTGDPTGTLPSRGFSMNDWETFLPELDYLVLTAALNQRTRRLFGAKQLALLPPRAFLLNPARAQLVDEASLPSALESGAIAGAALTATTANRWSAMIRPGTFLAPS